RAEAGGRQALSFHQKLVNFTTPCALSRGVFFINQRIIFGMFLVKQWREFHFGREPCWNYFL
ncbi:MAG: hypothetical protein ACK5NJ_10115, partial [Citrobacter portucalensis]